MPTEPPFWIWHYVPRENLKALDTYKYNGTDNSILVELFLRRFWNWCIEFFPLWIAPNLVTVIGFIFLISNYVIGIFLCGCTTNEDCFPKAWYFLLCSFNVFVYQLMDNLDGKQARRTDSSSALGEIFDHGCDSLYLPSMTICISTSLQMEPSDQFFLLTCGLTIFFASHWEEYHTNHLVLGRFANPTEAEIFMMIVLAVAGIFGPSFYSTPITFLGGLTLTKCVVWGTFGGCMYSLFDNSLKVIKWTQKHNKSLFYGISPIIPIILQVILTSFWFSKSNLISTATTLVHTFSGLLSSYLCNELVICRITKIPFSPINRPILVLPLIGVFNSIFTSTPIIPEVPLLIGLLVVLFSVYVYLLVSIGLQFTHYLDKYVFWIPLVDKPKNH